jgi:hypothetical protein
MTVVAVFFDLVKAYDTTWQYGIMKDLYRIGILGRLPIFIQNCLAHRHFRARVKSTCSGIYRKDLGVPQGSILSVTLFGIKVNSIVNAVRPDVTCSICVDDLTVYFSGRNMNVIERQIQRSINGIPSWSVTDVFKFSKTKTVCMHLCQLRRMHREPEFTMDGGPIRVVKETKFLGLILDNKLSFIPHIKRRKIRC